MGHGAELSGCGKCMKYLMFAVNFLTLVGGAAVLAVGIWTFVDQGQMEDLLGTNLYVSSAAILVATGVVVVIISFFGCFGAVKEIKCMLLTYFIIMFAVFATMLIGGILGYVFQDEVQKSMKTRMHESIRDYGSNQSQTVTDAWDFTQENLKCCGVEGDEGYKIWMKENPLFQNEIKVPQTCCLKSSNNTFLDCQSDPQNTTTYFNGCYGSALQVLQDQAEILGAVGIGISFVMLTGMIFSMALFKMIN